MTAPNNADALGLPLVPNFMPSFMPAALRTGSGERDLGDSALGGDVGGGVDDDGKS